MSRPKLAFLGAGKIADFHAEAAREAGFDLVAVAASAQSARAIEFAKKHDFSSVYSHPDDLIGAEVWDALLICTSHETLLEYTLSASRQGHPLLVEKPVGLNSQDLFRIMGDVESPVAVAYNRRHYSPVAAAKDFLEDSQRSLITVEIPESVGFGHEDLRHNYKNVVVNSVHLLDLLRYLAGPLSFEYSSGDIASVDSPGRVLLGHSSRGDTVIVKAGWNSPANFSISIEHSGQRFLLSPIERGQLFDGLQVSEPTAEVPVRTYSPNLVKVFSLDPQFAHLKPGFAEQMVDFKSLVQTGEGSPRLASLEDAYHALWAAERLLGFQSAATSGFQ